MTPDIERLAKEAVLIFGSGPYHHGPPLDKLAKFAALVAEECAKVAERPYKQFKDIEEMHYRYSGDPFNGANFGLQMDVVRYSRNAGDDIRAKFALSNDKPEAK